MRAFRRLYLANLTEFLSNRRALFLTIAFPVLFICIFGAVFTNQDKADATVGIASDDPQDPVTRGIVQALDEAVKGDTNRDGTTDSVESEKNPFSKLTLKPGAHAVLLDQLKAGQLDAVIFIPAGLSKAVADAKQNELETAALARQTPGGAPPPEAPPRADAAPLVLTIDPRASSCGPCWRACSTASARPSATSGRSSA